MLRLELSSLISCMILFVILAEVSCHKACALTLPFDIIQDANFCLIMTAALKGILFFLQPILCLGFLCNMYYSALWKVSPYCLIHAMWPTRLLGREKVWV